MTYAIAMLLAALGIALQAWIVFFEAEGMGAVVLGWGVYASLPYAACLYMLRRLDSPLPAAVGAVPALCFDAMIYHSVFIAPTASTAAIVLVFSPQVSLVLAVVAIAITHHAMRMGGHKKPRAMAGS